MLAKIILVDKEPKESEVWMQEELGTIFIVHPLFTQLDGQLHQVGLAIDDNIQKRIQMFDVSLYKMLKRKCVRIGTFEPDKDEFSIEV